MRTCERYGLRLQLHLDDELDADERRGIEAHLERCSACRGAFTRERLFREGIRRRRPLHVAPDALRAQITSMVRAMPATLALDGVHEHSRWWPPRLPKHLEAFGAAVAIAALAAIAGNWYTSGRLVAPVEAADFPAIAMDAHRRHWEGRLPLEVTTGGARDVSQWFEGKIPFDIALPDYRGTPTQDGRYVIQGARLVGFDGGHAAYVAYRMEQRPVSLVIASTGTVKPAGGQTASSKGIDFHLETIDGLRVITWTHQDLAYALVSDTTEHGQKSCMVCHQDAKDRVFLDDLAFLDDSLVSAAEARRALD